MNKLAKTQLVNLRTQSRERKNNRKTQKRTECDISKGQPKCDLIAVTNRQFIKAVQLIHIVLWQVG